MAQAVTFYALVCLLLLHIHGINADDAASSIQGHTLAPDSVKDGLNNVLTSTPDQKVSLIVM